MMVSRERFLVMTTLLAMISSLAFGSTITQLEFDGWNPDVLSTNGGVQLFPNAAPGLDVTVTSFGEFDAPTTYLATTDGGENGISSTHAPNEVSECHGYVFTFSQPTDIVLTTESIDAEEKYTISSTGNSVNYTNDSGASPVIMGNGTSSIMLDGTAFGRDPLTGSADGSTLIEQADSGQMSVRIEYCADPSANAKHGLFRVFSASPAVEVQSVDLLPEPSPVSLLVIGGLFILLGSRRRRR